MRCAMRRLRHGRVAPEHAPLDAEGIQHREDQAQVILDAVDTIG